MVIDEDDVMADTLWLPSRHAKKRRRHSPSPGELRLEHDLELLGWNRAYQHTWKYSNDIYIRRLGNLLLQFHCRDYVLQIELPKFYPHAAPHVRVIQAPPNTTTMPHIRLTVTTEQQQPSSIQNNNTYPWSPIQTLRDLLQFLMQSLLSNKRKPSQTIQDWFAPNRFDVGYERPNPNHTTTGSRAMECG